MTDPRLLVPLNLLPPVSGAPLMHQCACLVSPLPAYCYTCAAWPVPCLDLSLPDVVNDMPVRPDMLWWACAVLDTYGYRNAARALLGYDADVLHWSDVVQAIENDKRCGRPALDLTPGKGMYRPHAARAAVAEALRKGRPGVAP